MDLPLLLTRIDKLVQVLLSNGLLRALLRYQVLSGAEHRHILSPNMATVVGIGANRGQFSLAVRRWGDLGGHGGRTSKYKLPGGDAAPKQEKWIYRNKEKLNVKFIRAVGGVFDFFSGISLALKSPKKFNKK